MLTTELCTKFDTTVPIWNAGMAGGLAGVELAAAVSNAGGLGVLGMGGLPTAAIPEHVRGLCSRTSKPFGVNLIMPLMDDHAVDCCLAERVPVLILFWGDPAPHVEPAHAVGTRIVVQVGSVEQAQAAAAAGVDAVIVQGVEAGGRNQSTTPLSVLLPATVDAIHPVPVIAAGGIADGRGLAAALDLGAQGVSLGTRFLCSTESQADPGYKQRVARAHASETVLTTLFDLEWPDTAHRVLQNKTIQTWQEAGSPPAGERPGEGEIVGRMPVGGQTTELGRYSVLMPLAGFAGDLDDQVLYCGQSCALINTIQPADEIMSTMIHDAEPLATHHTG